MIEIQTRSEENGLRYFGKFQEALIHAESDITVWKISFPLPTGERIRLVRKTQGFVYEPVANFQRQHFDLDGEKL